jgi:hypothetical protein
MSEAKEVIGEVEAVSKTDRGTGIKIGGQWYNSTAKTVEAMSVLEKGDTVKMHFFENDSNGKVYRNVISIGTDDDSIMITEENIGETTPARAPTTTTTRQATTTRAQKGSGMELAKKLGLTVNLQGREYITHAGLLVIAHQLGMKGVKSDLVQLDLEKNIAIIKTTVVMPDGEYEAYGDSTPKNTTGMVATAFIRMAETRSVSRALRLATGVGMTSVEELGTEQNKEE